jgi:putative oxidoreductase
MRQTLDSNAPAATLLIRLVVGFVFLTEGIQKFLLSNTLGVGRFAKIGIPSPDFFAPFVGAVEIVCGLLILLGLVTRLASIPLLIVILVALWTTKLPILEKSGFWSASHEARADLSMLFCLGFLLMAGAGSYALDAWLLRRAPR